MRIFIAGAYGMVGTDLVHELKSHHEVQGLGKAELDIRDPDQCMERIGEFRPDIVINAAAFTDVDRCELQPEEAFQVNSQGSENIAVATAACDALLVHFSTDYIFDGTKRDPYDESDMPNPQSVYGKSKLEGEERVRSKSSKHLILRTSWLFGCHGKNFIRTIIGAAHQGQSLRVVHDQQGSPSFTRDLALQTRRMLERVCVGTYHVTNSGSCTWYELASRTIAWAGLLDVEVMPVSTADFPRPAARPANSVLSNERLKREGLPRMRPWENAVQDYIRTCLAGPTR